MTARKWLLDQWAEETARTLQTMTDARPEASCHPVDASDKAITAPDTALTEIVFSSGLGSMWLAIPAVAGEALGNRALTSAGVDDCGPEEVLGTCKEIVQQAYAGLSQAISRRVQQGVTSQGRDTAKFPDEYSVFRLDISYPDTPVISTYFTFAPQLLAGLEEVEEAPAPPPSQAAPSVPDLATANLLKSRTFEVLLEVSMPVSVSFGRTEMPIKDILKLTTGSIVELNRHVTHPVDVIVNDRIVARGEVVVVEGNYGVRIHEILSLQERFLTSTQAPGSGGKAELSLG